MGGVLAQLSAAGVFDAQADGEAEGEPVYLWPECVEEWAHWQHLQTQWRVGMAGATGLDYQGVRAYFDEVGIEPGEARRELFACIQACEFACLEVWADQRATTPPPTNR